MPSQSDSENINATIEITQRYEQRVLGTQCVGHSQLVAHYKYQSPTLGVLVESVRLVAGRLGFYSESGYTKDYKSGIHSFPPGARHKRKYEGISAYVLFVL